MMHCVGLIEQKNIRDLQLLPEFVPVVDWLDAEGLASADGLAVIGGLWLHDQPALATKVLRQRSSSGLGTLIVPRLRAGDYAQVLDTPTAVQLKSEETSVVIWDDGEQFSISGVSYFDTALPVGRWAKTSAGLAILCYRAKTVHAPIVLCSAALTFRAIGVRKAEQLRLFERIYNAINGQVTTRIIQENVAIVVEKALDVQSFLDQKQERGAALCLGLLLTDCDREADLAAALGKSLGVQMNKEEIQHLLGILPVVTKEQLKAGLEQFGWGSYVRRLQTHRA